MESKHKGTDQKLIAKPFDYAGLVGYQEESIVSRTIIGKPAGTITIFAFDKDQSLSTHSAPYDALLQMVEGTGQITIEGVDYTVEAPQVIIMPADKPHAVSAPERFKMLLVMIKAK